MLKNDHAVDIIADDREQKSDVIQFLSVIEHVNVSIRRLSIGDYRIDNRLIVERKTLRDFATSIIDGRLFKQTICLANSNLMGVLIIEGTKQGYCPPWYNQRGHAGGADHRFNGTGDTGSSGNRCC